MARDQTPWWLQALSPREFNNRSFSDQTGWATVDEDLHEHNALRVQYLVIVDLYKFYLDIAWKAVIWYYTATGALFAYFLNQEEQLRQCLLRWLFLSLAADLASRRAAGPPQRILAVLYGGGDLPRATQEIEGMRALWGSSVDVLRGADSTKRDVLHALGREYDLVHFACHGTFEALDPLQSALFLDEDHTRDSKRITAGDLLGRRLPGAPTVSLSACSSSLTSYGMTNDCTGLTGSLLRAGARAVIGSRWAVFDDTAATFMCKVYEAMADGVSGSLALSRVQRSLRSQRGLEDWAAFSYLGVP
jgi:hypothetical protein